jgi:hypothetical protein
MDDQVIDINQARKNKQTGTTPRISIVKKKSKITLGQICESVFDMISAGKAGSAPFPAKYHVVRDSGQHRLLLREGDEQVVAYSTSQELASDIIRYLRTWYSHADEYKLTPEKADSVARYFIMIAEPLSEEPPPFREKSEEGLCFQRLSFDAASEWYNRDMPLFSDFLDRTSNSDALCAFIGSLFYPQADRQQYLYLHGAGGEGKGAIVRLLADIFGRSFRSEDATMATNNRFWTAGLLGKRLVAFPDTNFASFLRTGLLKSLTGGDAVRMERKNQDPGSSKLTAKFMFVSNKTPDISGESADTRRIIYCSMLPKKLEHDPQYQEKLWLEAPTIISFCKAAYRQVCPTHGLIPVDKEQLDFLVDDNDEEFETAFETYFKKEPGTAGITRAQFRAALRQHGYNNNMWIADFKAYLARVHGIKTAHLGTTERKRVYETLQLKPMGVSR